MGAFVAAHGCVHHPVTDRGLGVGTGFVHFDAEQGVGRCLGDGDVGDVDNEEMAEQQTLGEVAARFG